MKKQFSILTIILLLSTSQVFAGFSLSGSTITQSGTDTSLAGLNGISGVDYYSYGSGITVITLNNLKLKITGTLTADLSKTILIFNANSVYGLFEVATTGDVEFISSRTINGYTLNAQQSGIFFALTTLSDWNRKDFLLTGSGKLKLTNITIKGAINPWLEPNASGLVDFKNVTISKDGVNSTANNQTNLSGDMSRIFLRDVDIFPFGTRGLTPRGANTPTIENVTIYQGYPAFNPTSPALFTVVGLESGTGSVLDITLHPANTGGSRVLNAVNGTDFILSAGGSGNRIDVVQDIDINLKDPDGNPVSGASFYLEDTPTLGTAGHTTNFDGLLATQKRTYKETTDANGDIPTTQILIGEYQGVITSGSPRPRGKNLDNTDIYDYVVASYNHNILAEEVVLRDKVSLEKILEQDENITEPTKTTVDAYTSIDNLDQLYDRAKSWKVDLANIEYPTVATQPVTASGTALDLGNRNLVIDNTAPSAFAVNTGTNTITIKASVLIGGSKFTNIKTTGTISTAGGSSLEIGYQDTTGTYKYIALSNLTNSDILIRDNTTGPATNIVSVSNFIGDYKAHFLAPTDASNTEVIVSRANYSSFNEVYPENDLSFIRTVNLQLTQVVAESQIEMLNLAIKILQKEEALYRSLDLTNPPMTVTNTISGSSGSPSVNNQEAILNILNKVFTKVIANRRKLE